MFEDVVRMNGDSCSYSFESLRKHTFASTGSRFSIECNGLYNYPISNRGFNPKTIGLHRLPNVKLVDCTLEKAGGHKMTIYISFSGVDKIRQTNYFYREEMAVINSAMNLASFNMSLRASSDSDYADVRDQIGRLNSFETKVKGKFGKILMNRKSSLGPKAMRLFAEMFDRALISFEGSDGVKVCTDPKMNGMRYDAGCSLLVDANVAKAITALNRGHYFTANLAGIKNTFKERPDLTLTLDDAYHDNFDEDEREGDAYVCIQKFVESRVRLLYRELRTEMIQVVEDSDFLYYFDVGVEITSMDDALDLVTLTTPADEALRVILDRR